MFKKKKYTSTVYCSILPEEMLCVFEYGDTDILLDKLIINNSAFLHSDK